MNENVKSFLKHLASCPEYAKIYHFSHPEVTKAINKTYADLQVLLRQQPEIIIGIVGDELTFQDDIFFDLSQRLSNFIRLLKGKGIEKMTFGAGVTSQEMQDFVLYFVNPENKLVPVQAYLESHQITHIGADKIRSEDGQASDGSKKRLSTEVVYTECLNRVTSSLTNVIEGQDVNFANFYLALDGLIKGLGAHYQEILKLSKLKGKDVQTFAHLLHVALLAIHFAKNLGFDKEAVRNMGMAGLFHDIGKLYIANSILKGKQLSDAEFESMKGHPTLGCKILLPFVDDIGLLPVVVAMQHHLHFDGNGGYPHLQYARSLHLGSMMISLCDVYDALSEKRSYKDAFPPEKIYNIMKGARGKQFHPGLFDTFFRFMGVWPNGTVVRLNNGAIAKVREQNAEDIFSPFVEVVDQDAPAVVALHERPDLSIDKSLNPLKEGKPYL
jgi:putative nucleotidyltransferase with HDIG domain